MSSAREVSHGSKSSGRRLDRRSDTLNLLVSGSRCEASLGCSYSNAGLPDSVVPPLGPTDRLDGFLLSLYPESTGGTLRIGICVV
jgi:hypothetical protein